MRKVIKEIEMLYKSQMREFQEDYRHSYLTKDGIHLEKRYFSGFCAMAYRLKLISLKEFWKYEIRMNKLANRYREKLRK